MKDFYCKSSRSIINFLHALKFPQLIKKVAIALVAVLLMSQSSWAEVSYIDADGSTQTCTEYTSVTGDSASWSDGWYVVDSNAEISGRISVSGTVHLILADGYTLTAPKGINVSDGNSLTIYGQANSTGTLTIRDVDDNDDNYNNAGIGGNEEQSGGNITINGGTINVTGSDCGAGIGGGYKGAGGTITISGGTVTAMGGEFAAGIGGGYSAAGGTVIINGGTVNATGDKYASGIGGGGYGAGGTITINGGTVTATGNEGGSGIGGGNQRAGGNITINGGIVSATGIGCGNQGSGGNITLGWTNITDSVYTSSYSGTVTISDDKELACEISSTACGIYSGTLTDSQKSAIAGKTLLPIASLTDTTSWADCWYKLDNDLTISDRITVTGTAHLVLNDGFTLSAPKGITVSADNSLTIYGQTNNTGKLMIDSVDNYIAGIGGGGDYQSSGTITINGGYIDVAGSSCAPGIGAGYKASVGTITINGGTVNATGNRSCAGIGGNFGAGGTVIINGGTVNATGGVNAAGIGGGLYGAGGTITISGGTVTATGGQFAAGIGGGYVGSGGTITISGGTVTATGGEKGAGIGGGDDGSGGTVSLSWTEESDSIYASSYSGDVTISKGFILDGTTTAAVSSNIGGKKIVPSTKVHAVSADSRITVNAWEYEGNTVTLSCDVYGYDTVYSVNGNAIDGNTFEMPSSDVTIALTLTPTTYTITYNLNGGSADNPGTYTIESADFKLNNPTKTGYAFTGWTLSGDKSVVDSDDLTITTGTTGNMTYIAGWDIITYTISYNLNGGNADNPTSYTVEDAITLNAPTRTGFTFTGWTGTNLTEATTAVTIAQGSTGDRSYSAVWNEGGYSPASSTEPEFVYHQLILSGQLDMMFFVYIPDTLSADECTMDFNVSGDTSQNEQGKKYSETMTADGYTLYGYECFINSVQMADEIHATLNYGDGHTLTHSYTVAGYLELIANNDAISDDTRELARATIDYGSYVQPVLAAENSWDIGEKHAKIEPADDFTDEDITTVSNDTASDAISYTIPDGSGIAKVEYTLLLESATTIEVYLTKSNDYSGNVVVYLDGGSDNISAYENGEYVARISNIPAHRLDSKHTLKVVTGDVSFNITVSALSYVHRALQEDSDSLKKAATSIYRYWDANMIYRNNRPDEY